MEPIEAYLRKDGCWVFIYPDEDAVDPRSWDETNVGKMYTWHSRYRLGDEHNYKTPTDFWEAVADEICAESWGNSDCAAVKEWVENTIEHAESLGWVVVPIYLYDHSGLKLSTGSFNDQWDSGQVGWYVITADEVNKEFSHLAEAPEVRDATIRAIIDSEVQTMSDYVNGSVYRFEVEDPQGEVIHQESGYYGFDHHENGLLESADAEDAKEINLHR